jgi:PPM family protein phosphatase
MAPCPACAAPTDPADRFCEACGADLRASPPGARSADPGLSPPGNGGADPRTGPPGAGTDPRTGPPGARSADPGLDLPGARSADPGLSPPGNGGADPRTGPPGAGGDPGLSPPGACGACGATDLTADGRCAACGADPPWRSSLAPPGACRACGATDVSADGYCEACGRRRTVGHERVELALDRIAAVTDRGRRRGHNEDAVAIGQLDNAVVAIVCDGVSASPHADAAAHAAVGAGMATMLRELERGTSPARATEVAFRAALAEVAKLGRPDTRRNPPSCTYVSGIVTADAVVVGWVGDSRAYWVPAGASARQLTDDDSMAGQLTLQGVAIGPQLSPHLAALTRWVGADAGPIEARVTCVDRPGPGTLILCSDGLSRYLAGPGDLDAVAGWPAARTAHHLTELALDAGGIDNIAVAALPFPPVDPTGEPSP